MTIEKIREVFSILPSCTEWTLQLLKITPHKRAVTSYVGREISLHPQETLRSLIQEISDRYTKENNGILSSYNSIAEYDSTSINGTIYSLQNTSTLIEVEYNHLIKAIADPDTELDPLEFKSKAYVLRGLTPSPERKPIKLISMHNPITSLKHKFLNSNGTFKEITDKVISLRTLIDIIIIDDTVYMLNAAGEKLFNMKRAHKLICSNKLDDINKCNIVTDFENFSSTSQKGHNPRKFISFNEAHLRLLKNPQIRENISKKFDIPMKKNLFDTERPGVTEKLIKILCNRGMVDPFDNNPMEVPGAKRWS